MWNWVKTGQGPEINSVQTKEMAVNTENFLGSLRTIKEEIVHCQFCCELHFGTFCCEVPKRKRRRRCVPSVCLGADYL